MNYLEMWADPEWQRMNGWAAPGDKVVYSELGGSDFDKDRARSLGLVKGEFYLVKTTNIESSNSWYTLEDYGEERFNCCLFDLPEKQLVK